MHEAFLHYIWQHQLFDKSNLQTTAGERVEVLGTGRLNRDAGPDFSDARVRIGGTLWAGNVEVHIRSSDWYKHGHGQDSAYDSVVLQVVHNPDEQVRNRHGAAIPTAALHFDEALWARYDALRHEKSWVPCAPEFGQFSQFDLRFWMEELTIERLQRKATEIEEGLAQNRNHWEETFYQQLAQRFGGHVNAQPFLMLAQSLPLMYLGKHKDHLMQVEALLFGQAGLLEGQFEEEYPLHLQQEYRFLQKKFELHPLAPHLWKFLRMRPTNFPTVRMAQFAMLVHRSQNLFSKLVQATSLDEIRRQLHVSASAYWDTHYKFDKASAKRKKTLGKATIDILIINTIVPFIFVYGKHKGIEAIKERALDFLRVVPPERNHIITGWRKLGIAPADAFDTQALIELKKNYCDLPRCLECRLGHKLLRKAMAK